MRRWFLLPLLLFAFQSPVVAQRSPAASRTAATRVILVRHAEKRTDNPMEMDPHLTAEGQVRARQLYDAVKRYQVKGIIITQLRRTRETAAFTAESLGIQPVVVRTRGKGDRNAAETARLIRGRFAGKTVLVVGHQTTIPRIVRALGGPQMGDLCTEAYSNVFVLELRPNATPTLTRSHYGAADQPDDEDCVGGIRR